MDASGDHHNLTLSTASIHACSCFCTCTHGLALKSLGMGTGRKLALQKEVDCLLLCLWLCDCYRAWLWTLESALPPCLSWQDGGILNPSSKIIQSFRIWLKSKLLWSPLSVPFPIAATDSHLLFQGVTDAHAVTQVIQSKTNPDIERDYFSSGSVHQVKSTGQSQEQQWRRRDGTDSMWWGTQQDCNCPGLKQLEMPQSLYL